MMIAFLHEAWYDHLSFIFPVEMKTNIVMPSDIMELAHILFHHLFYLSFLYSSFLSSFFFLSFCDLSVHPNMMMDVGFGMYQTQ